MNVTTSPFIPKTDFCLKENNKTLVRMEVPCCGGLQRMLQIALEKSGKNIPFEMEIISRDGKFCDLFP